MELQPDAELGADHIFSVSSSRKALKELQTSDADIFDHEHKGKLFLTGNVEDIGWGSKAMGGQIAMVKGKPQFSADDVTGFDRYVDRGGLAAFRQLREED